MISCELQFGWIDHLNALTEDETDVSTPANRLGKLISTKLRKPIASASRCCSSHVYMLLIALLCCLTANLPTTPASAQGRDLRNTGLNPFPKDDIYRLHLFGDWWMNALEPTLTNALKAVPRIQPQSDRLEILTMRRTGWSEQVEEIKLRSKETPIDMAVVMFGVSEIGSLYRYGEDRVRFGTEQWLKLYARRIDKIMKALRANGGAVYWVSIPIVRRRDHSEGFQLINKLTRERAYANGVTFVDIYSRFQNESGGFDRYGPDLTGTIKLLRSKDGVYFTGTGYAKIAHYVMQAVRRDLARVKEARVVTLAGSTTEQELVRRNIEASKTRSGSKKKTRRTQPGSLPGATRFGGQKADNGKVEFNSVVGGKSVRVTLDLPRPALSAAIMTLVTRNQSKDKPARFGDNAVQVIEGGVPLLSTVTPADQSALALRKRRLSPTQSVFFKVWGKGERLDPKPGRADDFQWPRPKLKPVVHVSAKPAAPRQLPLPPRDPNLPPLPEQRPE